ncbi:MAG TPA: LPS assembly lipoprotein LptE [Methylophilus sp.]
MILLVLTGCGFHLRAPAQVPFKNVQISGTTLITEPMRKAMKAQGVRLVVSEEDADLRVELIKEENEKRILSLSGTGVVREYELYYRVQYRTKVAGQAAWSLPFMVEGRRDYTYNDTILLGKASEEKYLIETMQTEVMNAILHRISAMKKEP